MPICIKCNEKFIFDQEDVNFCLKTDVTLPNQCPQCRMIRRFMDRNPKNLYLRKCDKTGKEIVSQYHKDQNFPVYSPEAWWGNDWDGLEYGMEYDFNKTFTEQYLELKNKVPHLSLFNKQGTVEDGEFNNCSAYLKNCHFVCESDYCEDSSYSNQLLKCDNVVDCSVCYDLKNCYECIDCSESENLFYSQDSKGCKNSYFLKNCQQCENCIGCINLKDEKFMIFNKRYSEKKYNQIKAELALNTDNGIIQFEKKCHEFFLTQPHKHIVEEHNENSSGDHLFHSKNSKECFDCVDLQNCRYCQKLSMDVKNSMDYNSWGNHCEYIYQCSSVGDNCRNLKCCNNCQTEMSDCEYCTECFNSSNLFGCVGLKNKKYCIFNKQYTKEEYEALVPKIVKQMEENNEYGQYFANEICAFGYNESMAMDIFPLEKVEAEGKGFKWREKIETSNRGEDLNCKCKSKYKLIQQEVDFYKANDIPIPNLCHICRHHERMRKRRPLKLWERNCEKCLKEIQSTYSSDRPEKIYCHDCFIEEAY